MSTVTDRGWMNKRKDSRGYLRVEFSEGVDRFLDFTFSNEQFVEQRVVNGRTVCRIRCPCMICENVDHKDRDEVKLHLLRRGFKTSYTRWYAHGETENIVQHVGQSSSSMEYDETDGCDQMLMDNRRMQFNSLEEQEPNPHAKAFYDMAKAADQPLWEGCQKFSKLEAATRLLNWKAECNVSETTYNRVLALFKEMLPEGEQLVGNFYETKKMLKQLGLPKEKIHVCKNHCMLFYKELARFNSCRVCGEPRYKTTAKINVPNLVMTYLPIAPRLQRLYMAKKTAKYMTWHHDHQTEQGKMVHPSDGEAWKHFDRTHPEFAQEIGNVRLGLCTDGFNPNNSNSNLYSLWLVFLTNYNLPPWLGLKESYVHLALVIPGRKSPGQNLDVFLRPLIDELKMLFEEGVYTYDAYRMTNFTMRAILLWTVSDFPAYAILSGWSTHGKLACPYCMNRAGSFQLKNGRKPCWFDCHRKFLPRTHRFRRDKRGFRNGIAESSGRPRVLTRDEIWEQVRHLPTVYDDVPHSKSNRKPAGFGVTHNWIKKNIFWELPYWHTLMIRHNLDVMHIEKNVFENLFHTIMDTPKTKDNDKARKDIEHYCNRPELHLLREHNKVLKLKASYTLSKPQVQKICEWLKCLRFSDGYVSNIGGCVNLEDVSFYGFKSHDCHVFMQRLLPISIKGMVPSPIWDAVTELCTFFRAICSRVLHIDEMKGLQTSIGETICKLEKVFPPGFFDSMEHLVVHLAREAELGGPVQYRWMYLYERRLGSLKRTVRNKARVEGSIVESYLVGELSTYCSLYFDPTVETRLNHEPRNFAPEILTSSGMDSRLSIFKVPSRRLFDKAGKSIFLSDADFKKTHTYILLNCTEVYHLHYMFDDFIRDTESNVDDGALDRFREEKFAEWFEKYVMNGSNPDVDHLKVLAQGPIRYVWSHPGYFVNGYKFHTRQHGDGRVTNNSGVCVRGSCYNDSECDYYGLLDEILEFQYTGGCVVVLFRCTWFDTVHGVRVDRKHNLVDIKHRSRLGTDDPFVLASQAEQVYYAPYPSKDMKEWWVVVKTKPRGIYELAQVATSVNGDTNVVEEDIFQENECIPSTSRVGDIDEPVCLVTEEEYVEVVDDQRDTHHQEDSGDEEDEYEDSDDSSSNNEEPNFSDHSSDE